MPRAGQAVEVDHDTYPDVGCEVSPTCLSCGLPRCKYDDPAWYKRAKQQARFAKIAEWRKRGLSVQELAHSFGVSKRTVNRALTGRR